MESTVSSYILLLWSCMALTCGKNTEWPTWTTTPSTGDRTLLAYAGARRITLLVIDPGTQEASTSRKWEKLASQCIRAKTEM